MPNWGSVRIALRLERLTFAVVRSRAGLPLSATIGRAFFPAHRPIVILLVSVAIFGVGFAFRPLGGIVIGAYADRAGRHPAMLLTIALITAGTLGLALMPPYASIGLAPPVFVVLCRIVQGFALGGEIGPATAFLIEIAPPRKRGLYSSWQPAMASRA